MRLSDIPKSIRATPPKPAAATEPVDDYAPVGIDGLLAASEKLLAMNRGLTEPDERDSYAYKRVMSAHDHLGERIRLDAGKVRRGLIRNAARNKSLRGAYPFAFDPYSSGLIIGDPNNANPLSAPMEEINPMHIMEAARRITQMGPGGIGTSSAITTDATNVHTSQFGFVSPIEGPECAPSDTEVFTSTGWMPWPLVTKRTALACRINGQMQFHRPSRVIHQHYRGPMIEAIGRSFNFKFTPTHRLWCAYGRPSKRDNPDPKWLWTTAAHAFGKCCQFDTGSAAVDGDSGFKQFQIPHVELMPREKSKNHQPIDIEDWCEFMGWYLSEGSFTARTGATYCTQISQSYDANPACVERIKWLLDRLPFRWKFYGERTFSIPDRALATYLSRFGFCDTKHIPEELFHAPVSARKRLLHSLFLGDGRITAKHTTFCSTSKQLRNDVDRLATGLGYTTRAAEERDSRPHVKTTNYVLGLLKLRMRIIGGINKSRWETSHYDGMVHCATVPGGMLLTRRGYGNTGVWSGNSEKAGIDTRISSGARIGSDGRLYQQFRNRRTQELEWVTPQDLEFKNVAMPD